MAGCVKKIAIPLAIVGVLIVVGIVSAITGGADYEYTTEKVKRGDLVQSVEATGSVKSTTKINLDFKVSGKLAQNSVKVGELVEEGQLLAELDSKDALLEVERARSALALAYANLNLKVVGESDESIKVYEEEVVKANSNLKKAKIDLENTKKSNEEDIREAELNVSKYKTALTEAENNLVNTKLSDTQTIKNSYDDARVVLDSNLISVSTSMTDMDNILGATNTTINDNFEKYLGSLNPQAKTDAENSYRLAINKKESVFPFIESLSSSSSYSEIKSAISDMKDLLEFVAGALNKTRTMLDSSTTGGDFSSTTLEGYKTTINTDRTTINTGLTSLQTKEQAILTSELDAVSNLDTYTSALSTAQNNLDSANQVLASAKVSASNSLEAARAQIDIMEAALASAEASLTLKKASPRDVDLASLRAQVDEARAALELAEEKLENTKIKAPAAGVITAVNYEPGEQVVVGSSVASSNSAITLVGDQESFKVEVDISESDIPKLSVGDRVEIDFDAFGQDEIFSGEVVSINPAETVIQDVVYYQVDISISDGIDKVKPGMTANVEIFTDERKDVLYVSQRAVLRKDGGQVVRILEKKEPIEISVETGLRANDGLLEIISGPNEGEEVITYIKEKK